MSSAELKKVSGANPLIEEASRELTDLLAGRISDTQIVASRDRAIRQFVITEVLAATAAPDAEIQRRARQLFVEYGYLDELIHDLRNAQAGERVAAARILGEFGSDLATPALVEALLDSEPAVRSAAAAALMQIGEPQTAFERTPHLQQPPRESASLLFPDQVKSDPPTSKPQRHTVPEQSAVLYSANDQSEGADLQSLFLKEDSLGKSLEEMEDRLLKVTSALTEVNKEIQLRAEAALKFKREATTLRQQEEKCRKQAEEATRLHETEIELKAQAEQARQTLTEEVTLLRVDVERSSEAILKLSRRRAQIAAARRSEAENARRQADEIYNVELGRLRSEEIALRQAAEKTAMRRAEVQQARRAIEKETLLLLEQQSGAAPEASRLAEAERLRRQAEERHRAEQEQLRIQIDKLSRVADEVAARKASIEVATKNAEAEAEELAEGYARMQVAEEIRRQTEIERARLEEQILSSLKEEGHLLEETRARLPEKQRIDEFGIERLSQDESRQLADFEEFRGQQELEVRKRSVIEQQILSEIERMAEAEADARRRIEHADLRRRAAEDACRQVEEKARKVEAEARRRVVEEEQALAKLQTIRLDVDADVQARAEQERRIKEEIEQLRRLAEEAGLRIEAEARRRAQAEARLHEERQRLSVEESDRLKVERQHHLLVEQAFPVTVEDESWRDEPGENLRRIESPAFMKVASVATAEAAPVLLDESVWQADEDIKAGLPAGLMDQLNSEDPLTRAAAVTELASVGTTESLKIITDCFEDHSPDVRDAAARALHQFNAQRPVELFTKVIEEGPAERRRNIGAAMAASGLAAELIGSLPGGSLDDTHDALGLLLLMAKTGEVQPLVKAIEEHDDFEVRRAAVRLLTLSGQSEIADAAVKRRLNVGQAQQ